MSKSGGGIQLPGRRQRYKNPKIGKIPEIWEAESPERWTKHKEEGTEVMRWDRDDGARCCRASYFKDAKTPNSGPASGPPAVRGPSLGEEGRPIKLFNLSLLGHFLQLQIHLTASFPPSTWPGYEGLQQGPVFQVRPHWCRIKGDYSPSCSLTPRAGRPSRDGFPHGQITLQAHI